MNMKKLAWATAVAVGLSMSASATAGVKDPIKKAVAGEHRSAKNKARDGARHPEQTLKFLGLKPGMTVVEIWPGGGWYTEVIAPVVKGKGKFYAAHFDADAGVDFFTKSLNRFQEKFVADKKTYGDIHVTTFNPPSKLEIAPAGSADMVLTFRNVHNWYMRGDEEGIKASFGSMFKALKPGGILGVVDHRLPESRDQKKDKNSGYMKQSLVIKWAEDAGFKLVDKSEVNANPKDSANHPKGVWTLPPRLRLGDKDRAKYEAIGESDRMTLKFVKPAKR
ncbi:class I SAM-dependent methyltransferase [Pleionea sp. CnH1-48]|uniref:class I SAM-dependent methyltransferase n=1 Tax=Pleionea sp. CnH1-48 TaxID=2954494 RepID=UPI002096C02C|nr:methyltransferase [Pleionea sp. CnH1-48]MCO7226854.1 methyltransferase [Pleionea sp. CnH1-48]